MPSGASELTDLTLRDAGDLVHRRTISAAELVEATLQRLWATEPSVHAYAAVGIELARAQARSTDIDLARGIDHGPLHGIPVAVKDLIWTRELPTEAGSRVFEGHLPARDATVVTRLLQGGAVILGKTVTHEFGYGQNPLHTRNAWDHSRFPGGSSAGSAVSVAVGSAFASLGTDSGGSIRGPASMNGIVGLKPTYGRVSRQGVFPMSASLDQVGPLARTIDDCAIVLGAIAGQDPDDPSSLLDAVPEYLTGQRRDLRGVRLGICPQFFYADKEVAPAVDTALADLADVGADLVEVAVPWLEEAVQVGNIILAADMSAWHQGLLRKSGDLYDAGTRVLLEFGELIPATHYVNAQRARSRVIAQTRGLFQTTDLDALVGPTLPMTAQLIEELDTSILAPVGRPSIADYVHHCFPANVTGQPALTIPCGFSAAGLPVGLQLIGRPLGESTLFDVGRVYEGIHSWHMQRPEGAPHRTTAEAS